MTHEPQDSKQQEYPEQPLIQERPLPPRPRAKFVFRAKKPYVTYAIMVVTILVFGLQMLSRLLYNIDYPIAIGAKINAAITDGQYWRLITPVFLHGSVLHISLNMYALYIKGRDIELFFGHLEYSLLYFLSGIGGTLFSYYLSPNASVGASGAIFGIIAAEAIMLYKNRNTEILGPQTKFMLRNSVMLIAANLLIGTMPNIDNWGHIGGMMIGIIFAWFASPMIDIQRMGNDLLIQLQSSRAQSIRVSIIIFLGITSLLVFKAML